MTEFDIRELLSDYEDRSVTLREQDLVSPDRIREDVMARIEKPVRRRIRRWTGIPLAAAICALALAATALAAGLLHLDERRGGVIDFREPPEAEGFAAMTPSAESAEDIVYTDVNAIGATGSPEYLAAREWNDWCLAHLEDNTLFPDGIEAYTMEEIDEITNAAEGDVYVRMGACTSEARAELDAIAAKYGLRLPESFREVHPKDLYDMTGETDILPWEVSAGTGIWYDGGGLTVINRALLENGKTINYDLIRSVRGMFSQPTNFVLEEGIPEEWEYTAADGTAVTLDLGPNRSVLMAELPNSFVYVHIRGGTENADSSRDGTGPDTLTHADLEAFADTIDFAALDSIR